MKQTSIPRPSVPAFSAGRALSMSGQAAGRGVFRPLAKDAAPPKSHWSGK